MLDRHSCDSADRMWNPVIRAFPAVGTRARGGYRSFVVTLASRAPDARHRFERPWGVARKVCRTAREWTAPERLRMAADFREAV